MIRVVVVGLPRTHIIPNVVGWFRSLNNIFLE
jgi:hypothetical protein